MIYMWFIDTFGRRWAKAVMIAAIVCVLLIVFVIGFNVWRWSHEAHRVAQANQNVKSGAAATQAGSDAVNKVNDRAAAEADIRASVQDTQKEIGNAQTIDDVFGAVVRGECGRVSDKARGSDPACGVRKPHS